MPTSGIGSLTHVSTTLLQQLGEPCLRGLGAEQCKQRRLAARLVLGHGLAEACRVALRVEKVVGKLGSVVVSLVVAWELSWYRFRIDLGDEGDFAYDEYVSRLETGDDPTVDMSPVSLRDSAVFSGALKYSKFVAPLNHTVPGVPVGCSVVGSPVVG